MAHPRPPFEGSCLCGAVRLHITAPPLMSFACHCHDCQKLSASAFSLTVVFPSDAVFVDCAPGGGLIRGGLKAGGGETGARSHFYCKSCLGLVYSRIAGAEHRVNLRNSVLNNAADFPPYAEFMADEKQPWVQLPTRRSFAGYPKSLDDLTALLAEYAAR